MSAFEKLVLTDGQTVVLFNARVAHFIDGKRVTGTIVDGTVVSETKLSIPYSQVQRHVALKIFDGALVEDLTVAPRSLF